MKRKVQFGLQAMFLALIVLGAVLGLVAKELKWIHDREGTLQWLQPLRKRQLAVERGAALPPHKAAFVSSGRIAAPWPLALLGERGVERIELKREFLDPDACCQLSHIQRLILEADVTVDR